MAAIRELCLTSLFLFVSQISALQTGNASKTACELSNVTIDFIFNLGNDSFLDRLWYKNSIMPANKIARVDSIGSLTVEPQYSGRVALSGLDGITLRNVNKPDSGSYLFVILTDIYSEVGTATTTVNVFVNPNTSCMPIIENNSAGNIICKISDACPGKDSIQAIWDGGSVGVFTCPVTTVNTKYKCCAKGDPVTSCYNGSLCTDIQCTANSTPQGKSCELELGLCLGLSLAIQCSITCIVVVIFMFKVCKDYTYPHKHGLLLGLGLGITFQVSWIIIVSLKFSGKSCELQIGLGLGLGSGIPYVIAVIIAVILVCIGNPRTVDFGKGLLKGLLMASVIGIFIVFLISETLKVEPPEPTGETPEEEPNDTKNKTKNKRKSEPVRDLNMQMS